MWVFTKPVQDLQVEDLQTLISNHVGGSFSQRVNGLKPKTYYALVFWASAKEATADSFFVTTDIQWKLRTYLTRSSYEWRPVVQDFNSEDSTYIDVRFVIETPCSVWIDDIVLMQMTDEVSRTTAVLKLTALREHGITDMLNRDVRTDDQWMWFAHDLKEWEEAVVSALRQAGRPETEVSWFSVLGTFRSKDLPGGTQLHRRDRNILAEKLERLLTILSGAEAV